MRLAGLVRPLISITARPRLFQSLTASSPSAVKRLQFATPAAAVMSQSQASPLTTSSASGPTTIITPELLSKRLTESIGATHTSIVDISGGCGQSFQAVIVSPQFEKKNTLARHRLVNAALKEQIAAIHAWSPRCYSPDEWDRAQAAQNPATG